jgi:hypothetical protein
MAQEIDDILSKIDDTSFGEYHSLVPRPYLWYEASIIQATPYAYYAMLWSITSYRPKLVQGFVNNSLGEENLK